MRWEPDWDLVDWNIVAAAGAVLVAFALVVKRVRAHAAIVDQSLLSRIPSVSSAYDIALTPDWTDEDFRTLEQSAQNLRMNPADYLLMLAGESNLHPWARACPSPKCAVGLNQLTSSANKSAGITEEQRLMIPELSVSVQLPIVERMYSDIQWTKAGKEYPNVGVVWEANFAPGRMFSRGITSEVILYDQINDPVAYKGNAPLDAEGKGSITVGDLSRRLRSVSGQDIYQAGLRRLNDVTGRDYAPRFA